MAKSLILLRHAKSSWSRPGLDDFDRPLNRRGERAAHVIGLFLKQENVAPDLVLCSAAKRTLQTWEAIRPNLPQSTAFEETAAIYEAGIGQLYKTLSEVSDNAGTILMIGHNPGLERLTASLCQGQAGEQMARVLEKFPTGALALIDLRIESWSAIAPGIGTLTRFVTPKELV
ncbi:histidine phosphatase family protein [Nisaea acidiphila]|uniref:Histidine phosphatase family protein n=1 Tax=Nisaea acidiphila TaxID=1862145 RepID=A0A9J7ARS9_9PROT|nr:histidine phosphatase family protein [Nisaea acidiphila]UUX50064.1 histidine phosphatase family protein [Nisaea acidiphila]